MRRSAVQVRSTAPKARPSLREGRFVSKILQVRHNRATGSSSRLDVLVDVEEIVRVILALYLGKPLIVVAIGGAHALLSLVIHHHVDIRTPCRIGMNGIPIGARPADQFVFL